MTHRIGFSRIRFSSLTEVSITVVLFLHHFHHFFAFRHVIHFFFFTFTLQAMPPFLPPNAMPLMP